MTTLLSTTSGKDDQLLIQLTWVASDGSRSVAATLFVAADLVVILSVAAALVVTHIQGPHPMILADLVVSFL
jgi:hypothetical protein